ncbi:pre-mRNA-processing factor 39 isoform X2 [Lontra canadensis]|uniref:Pre-mRNA-processing factor 39 n=2 Tax=Mustelinae TaxID=169418 RepID=A0A8U0RIB2_MUSPF|nr:pre-mRNA-processing factor 39 isoform X2 [Lontra canadensis]XP_044924997.1 pre-mRNA-processing factor 39 isoform X2 [Mustela putorius furo]
MQNSHMDEYRNSSNGSTGNSSEVVVEQSADFSTEIMNVTEMEQSPDGSPNVNAAAEENEVTNAVDLPVTETEANFPPEYEKFWKTVESNPQDFTGWVYLLQYVEQENHLMAARKAFDKFFIHYPYCYGYWKKYADLEKRHDNIKQSDEVYRRGLQAIPLSVDLWIHYINFLKETLDPGDPETNSTIRGFKEHVQNNLPRDLLTGEQFIQLRRELASVNGHSGDDGPPGDDLPSGIEDITDPAKLITEIENMRHRIIEIHQEMFNYNEHEVSKRWTFEEGIKRPYFHVKPLEKAQLKNWKEYLEFEIENGTHERVVVLFERCVISCALYEEFWIKYAKYMENHSIEGVRHVFSRACTIHLPKKPMVHMLWAAFEEQQGNINEARNILRTFEECVLGLAMVRLRRVSLERRHGNMEEAEHLLQDAIKNARSNNESSFYAIKLARHLFKIQKNLPKSRKVLLEAIERDKENTKLYLNLLEMEYSGDLKQNEENILNCFDRAIHGSLPIKMRITFSQRKVEFLEDFGSDVNKLLNAYDEHQTLLKEQDSLKRKAENGSEEPEEKKVHTEDTTSSSTQMIDGDLQANQAAYNYSAWYQYNYQNPWNYGQYYPPPPT